ncbi:uncharacterized protein HMPREF1541_04317 [Cyphellophora europaea CBS 101466]|uniref:Amidase domain-containing protein n=1 Tax=Cyphellophora europaea (strain CBS 101466) TaxID=1220924 RepID=W2RUC3_CYPE1|nr:uncharacterized protein HMPREF1541_04317 [Cyphellophora europaea CBS 101466]ETN40042.1 hypothetical protein HMPREF1541_04317 [Cyphellophora europaea CBS 101466]
MAPWQEIAATRQTAVLDSIPTKWRLPSKPDTSTKNVQHIPRTCGLITPDQLHITEQTTVELAAQLSRGKLTSVEVTEAFCARAAVAHQCVNCLTGFYYEEAMGKAAEADAILKETRKPVGPLHGVPIAIKDIFNIKGKRGTMGLVAWQDKEWGVDASIVTLLKAAGAIQFASTTMPQGGMMLQTVSPLWGRTLNPFNTDFAAGGSSGGDGTLLALRGSPFCPSTDIGGSIRAPAAFNGLYGIRPTADRIPKFGMISTAPGQTSIKVSCGPNCHSVGDLKLVTKLLFSHTDYIGFDPTAVPLPWKEVQSKQKLVLGMLKTDGVVTPQPPILRALAEVAEKLKAAGHEVVEIEPPIDLWEAALVTWKLYFQTGATELRALVSSADEPLEPQLAWYLDTFAIKELTVPELFQTNLKQAAIKRHFADFWAYTKQLTWNGSPIDGLICPSAPSASYPHDFPVWWGYFSIWNLLDYPSAILPLKDFSISEEKDPKDTFYNPIETNPFDKMNADIYNPKLWAGMPVSIQIVQQQFADEELLSVTEVVDKVVNSS